MEQQLVKLLLVQESVGELGQASDWVLDGVLASEYSVAERSV